MEVELFLQCLLIFGARLGDVTLGTLRTISVVRGNRVLAWWLGFGEVVIWIFAVSAVITNLDKPALAIAFALGFATGNWVGITVEKWLAPGQQIVRVFTRKGSAIAADLREAEFAVTEFEGRGRSGSVEMLFVEVARRLVPKVVAAARALDPSCFYIVDDVRYASAPPLGFQPTGWRAFIKKK